MNSQMDIVRIHGEKGLNSSFVVIYVGSFKRLPINIIKVHKMTPNDSKVRKYGIKFGSIGVSSIVVFFNIVKMFLFLSRNERVR